MKSNQIHIIHIHIYWIVAALKFEHRCQFWSIVERFKHVSVSIDTQHISFNFIDCIMFKIMSIRFRWRFCLFIFKYSYIFILNVLYALCVMNSTEQWTMNNEMYICKLWMKNQLVFSSNWNDPFRICIVNLLIYDPWCTVRCALHQRQGFSEQFNENVQNWLFSIET